MSRCAGWVGGWVICCWFMSSMVGDGGERVMAGGCRLWMTVVSRRVGVCRVWAGGCRFWGIIDVAVLVT